MLYCFPGLIVSTREYLALVRHLGPEQPATGFICYTLADDKQPDMSVENVTARYAEEIRRASAGRPVAFLGWSWGGLLAYEAARLLGEEIDLRLIGMLDVCDMDESFALGAEPVFAPGERERIHARVQDWLGRTRMREAWQTVLGRMDRLAYDQFLRHVSDKELHLDGPEIGSSEHIFWVLIDNALVFRRYAKRPFDVPIASWIAGDSITRGLNIIDWRRYSPRATAAELIPGTTHFDIVGSPSFHRLFARRLAIATESG
jgi:thioesterase domain-containing protein